MVSANGGGAVLYVTLLSERANPGHIPLADAARREIVHALSKRQW